MLRSAIAGRARQSGEVSSTAEGPSRGFWPRLISTTAGGMANIQGEQGIVRISASLVPAHVSLGQDLVSERIKHLSAHEKGVWPAAGEGWRSIWANSNSGAVPVRSRSRVCPVPTTARLSRTCQSNEQRYLDLFDESLQGCTQVSTGN